MDDLEIKYNKLEKEHSLFLQRQNKDRNKNRSRTNKNKINIAFNPSSYLAKKGTKYLKNILKISFLSIGY